MRITSVPPARASASQSVSTVSLAGSSWPVTTVKLVERPRWVTGIPAYAAAAIALVTPGTTSKDTPAAMHASASSPPRPKTKGSPPLSRTTAFPSRPCATSSALICSCVIAARPGALPTSMRAAVAGASSSSAGGREPVEHDHVGGAQQCFASAGQESWVAGTGPDQVHGHDAIPSTERSARPPCSSSRVRAASTPTPVGVGSAHVRAQHDVTVEGSEQHLKDDVISVEYCERAAGQVATTPELRKEGPLGAHGAMGECVVDFGEPFAGDGVVHAALGGECSLCDLGQHHRGVEHFARRGLRGRAVRARHARARWRRIPPRVACASGFRCCRATDRRRNPVARSQAGRAGGQTRCRRVRRPGALRAWHQPSSRVDPRVRVPPRAPNRAWGSTACPSPSARRSRRDRRGPPAAPP